MKNLFIALLSVSILAGCAGYASESGGGSEVKMYGTIDAGHTFQAR